MSKNFGNIYRSMEISVIFTVREFWDIEIELPFESHLPCQPNRNLIKPFGFIHKLSKFFLINMRIRIFHYSLVHSFLRKQRAGKGKDRERERGGGGGGLCFNYWEKHWSFGPWGMTQCSNEASSSLVFQTNLHFQLSSSDQHHHERT